MSNFMRTSELGYIARLEQEQIPIWRKQKARSRKGNVTLNIGLQYTLMKDLF